MFAHYYKLRKIQKLHPYPSDKPTKRKNSFKKRSEPKVGAR